ncbi:MAG: hypothetical protein WBV98_19680, partial [Candidatus Sulfotelmatobacter sp.]
DSVAVDFACEHAFEEGGCRGSEGCVAYDGRESLTFNGVPGNVSYGATKGDTDGTKVDISRRLLRDEVERKFYGGRDHRRFG